LNKLRRGLIHEINTGLEVDVRSIEGWGCESGLTLMKYRWSKLLAVLVVFGAAASGVMWIIPCRETRQETETVKVSLFECGVPLTVVAIVYGRESRPVSGVTVRVWNNSGFQKSTTDSNGVATLSMGEWDLSKIEVDKAVAYSRPTSWFARKPTVEAGIVAAIHLKESAPMRQ
jgi:hypothetical protein